MNASDTDLERMHDPWTIALGVILTFVVLLTVGGNILVLVAVGTSHLMQGVTNSFVSSLAWTDLLTGALVMPPNIAKLMTGAWVFGPIVCTLWNIVDIICGVASIETLCVIAIDRYVAITSPLRYKELMTPLRAQLLIAGVWLLSTAISVIPIMLGWFKSDDPAAQACYADPDCCEYVSGKLYTAISSVIVFYLPLSIMVFVYSRVLKEAERQVGDCYDVSGKRYTIISSVIAFYIPLSIMVLIHSRVLKDPLRQARIIGQETVKKTSGNAATGGEAGLKRNQQSFSSSERRALKTLSLVMGVFIACWLPFFICYAIQIFCMTCVPGPLFLFLIWLGDINSTFNPFLYSRSPEFMTAYKRILHCNSNEKSVQT